jgi:hypothetical protein
VANFSHESLVDLQKDIHKDDTDPLLVRDQHVPSGVAVDESHAPHTRDPKYKAMKIIRENAYSIVFFTDKPLPLHPDASEQEVLRNMELCSSK